MKKYSKFTVEKVNNADIRLIIPGTKGKSECKVECPFCHGNDMSVVHKNSKNFAHCFNCGESLSPIKAAQEYNGLGFVEALEYVAKLASIPISSEEDDHKNLIRALEASDKSTFCYKQLKESGLTEKDIIAKVKDQKGYEVEIVPIVKGGIGERFTPNEVGDEMLIYYYDLEGNQIKYQPKGSNALKPYVRVRWSNPEIHADQDGKAVKYQTPVGAKQQAYIPQYIRSKYQAGEHIETLFVQEGEKKAEKACKHGIASIGIQGINNFGSKLEGLLTDIQSIARVCTIKNIVLLMDSDWNDLSKNIKVGDRVDKRARSFSQAVIKFKTQCSSFYNCGLDVDIWWGHINKNERNDKGIDDLLTNTLKDKESDLSEDINRAMNSFDGKSKYVNIHKITTISDRKIEEFWSLTNDEEFFNAHKEKLSDLATFKIRQITYRVDSGKLIKISNISGDIDIWSVDYSNPDKPKLKFNIVECLELISNSGFYSLESKTSEGRPVYDWVRIENGIIDYTTTKNIRDYVYDYIKITTKRSDVHEMFASKLDVMLSDKKLERLDIKSNDFYIAKPGVQVLPYNNGGVEITSKEILPNRPNIMVWRNQIIPRKFERVKIIESISHNENGWEVELTEDGKKCEFLQYLYNVSNTFYRHGEEREVTDQEYYEHKQHLINKFTTIGYLMMDYKYSSEKKAIVAVDNRMSEVNQSNGGTGKSLFGLAIGKVKYETVIDGKKDLTDKFAFDSVNESTRVIFIDDIKTRFNFERLYPMITGTMEIERKNTGALKLSYDKSPKILITTNGAIEKASQKSTSRRISYIEFSKWYNEDYTPYQEFGHNLFDDWSDKQWNLFDNFMAECLMYYLRSYEENWAVKGEGIIAPPMAQIILRTLRQEIGEAFLQWADEYFSPEGPNVNRVIKKKDVMKAFFDENGLIGHGVSRSSFTDKMKAYIKFKGYDFNRSKPNEKGQYIKEFKRAHPNESFIGEPHKSGGLEWYEIVTEKA